MDLGLGRCGVVDRRSVGGVSGGPAGQPEEDFVQGRLAQGDVGHLDPSLLGGLQHGADRRDPVGDGCVHPQQVGLDPRAGIATRATQHPGQIREVGTVPGQHLEAISADHPLQALRGVLDDVSPAVDHHAWLLQVDQSRPLLGPNALEGMEQFLTALQGVPMTPTERMMVVVSVDALVSGVARLADQQVRAEARTGISDEEFWNAQAPVLESAMGSGRYPIMAALPMEAFWGSWDEQLDFALGALLDGLEKMVAEREA